VITNSEKLFFLSPAFALYPLKLSFKTGVLPYVVMILLIW